MLQHNPNQEFIDFTNTCTVCSKEFKDSYSLGGRNNTIISPTCDCGVVTSSVCFKCRYKEKLSCPKCHLPINTGNIIF